MAIDWFTFWVQVLNFGLLMFLLQRFLYRPLQGAIEKRQTRLQGQWDEVAQAREEAQREKAAYEADRQNLQQEKITRLQDLHQDIEREREILRQNLRQEMEQLQQQWYGAIAEEKRAFLALARQKTGEALLHTLTRVLRDMADVNLDHQMVALFCQRLATLSPPTRAALAMEAQQGAIAHITSAFPLAESEQHQIATSLTALVVQEIACQWQCDPHLLGGVVLRWGGQEMDWSLQSYLNTLADDLTLALATEEQNHGAVPHP